MRYLLDRLFNRTRRENRIWAEDIDVEVPPTPATRYVAAMLLQMAEGEPQTRVLNRSENLPTLTFRAHTAEPPPLDTVVKHLKEICKIEHGQHPTPVDGLVRCTIQGTTFNVKYHFDDNTDACCWIRVEKSDEKEDNSTPDNSREDSTETGSPRIIRYGTPEYRAFMRREARVPWRKRIRRSAICALICACLVLAALIAAYLILAQTQWPVLKMMGCSLLIGAFMFALMLYGYVLEDLLR